MSRGAAAESFAAPRLTGREMTTTAFSRGYILTPLRGWNRIIQNSLTSGGRSAGPLAKRHELAVRISDSTIVLILEFILESAGRRITAQPKLLDEGVTFRIC